jgi:hypothetical protein
LPVRLLLRPALVILPALIACTPLGLWVYEDPSMALREATAVRALGAQTTSEDSLELVLVGCNLNDYDLIGQQVRSQLAIGGQTVAEGVNDRKILLATRDTSRFTVVLPLAEVMRTTDGSPRPFELLVASLVQTPLGERDLTYSLRGQVQRSGDNLAWRVEVGKSCRPGGSALPNQFERSVPIDLRN